MEEGVEGKGEGKNKTKVSGPGTYTGEALQILQGTRSLQCYLNCPENRCERPPNSLTKLT